MSVLSNIYQGPSRTVKSPDEILNLDFDFSPLLGSGETLTSINGVQIGVISGVEDAPTVSFTDTPILAGANKQVVQKLSGGSLGIGYRITALVTTSGGQVLELGKSIFVEPA